MFDRIEIGPVLTGEERRRKKISEWARKRKRRKDGTFATYKRERWKPDKAFYDMVVKAFTDEGFPKSRIWFKKRQKVVVLNVRARGQRRVELILRRFYNPEKLAYFLRVFCQWDRSMRCKGGRSKRDPKKAPF